MADEIEYRLMRPGEERLVSDLVIRVFQEFIGPDYPRSGVRDFLQYASRDAIRERTSREHVVLVAATHNGIIGMVDIDDYRHIDLLFVDKRFHRQGIARELIERAVELCKEQRPDAREVTADTSHYGVAMYEAEGFEPSGPEQQEHGRRFVRMRLRLKK